MVTICCIEIDQYTNSKKPLKDTFYKEALAHQLGCQGPSLDSGHTWF